MTRIDILRKRQARLREDITAMFDGFLIGPEPSGLSAQDPTKNFSSLSSGAPVYRPPTITQNSLSGIC